MSIFTHPHLDILIGAGIDCCCRADTRHRIVPVQYNKDPVSTEENSGNNEASRASFKVRLEPGLSQPMKPQAVGRPLRNRLYLRTPLPVLVVLITLPLRVVVVLITLAKWRNTRLIVVSLSV